MKRRKDGRYQKQIVDGNGKKIYFYGATEREITAKILDYQEKERTGAKAPLFVDVANDWWDGAEKDLAVQTKKSYIPSIKEAINYFGEMKVDQITASDINGYLTSLANKHLSFKTISNRRSVLKMVLDYCVVMGYNNSNPCSYVATPKARKTKVHAAESEDEEIARTRYDVWLLPTIAIYSGLRHGEILALQWADINFADKIITVSKNLIYDGQKPVVAVTKTEAGERLVPLLDPLYDILLPLQGKPDDYIISDDGGHSPLSKSSDLHTWQKYKAVTGIKCTVHQLRHSMATMCLGAGLDFYEVKNIIGHKQVQTTIDIYADYRREAVQKSADKLNKIIKS